MSCVAVSRPPGHHSMHGAANGFCVFNNVAIAARYAKQKHGVKRYFDLFLFFNLPHSLFIFQLFRELYSLKAT